MASKKDEWMKAQEEAMEEPVVEEDDEFDLTYANGFGGSLDEVRKKKSPLPRNVPSPQKILTRSNGVTLRRRVEVRNPLIR